MIGAKTSHSDAMREALDFPHHRLELTEGSAIHGREDVALYRIELHWWAA